MANARTNLWNKLKEVCNKKYDIQGVQYWKYIIQAKDYVPLKDLKEWIRKEEIKQVKKNQEQDNAYKERGIHGEQ
tara:strand:+ start:292 stop:516 length:225 start_codon:yes stop_codon:yes gene_type:complete